VGPSPILAGSPGKEACPFDTDRSFKLDDSASSHNSLNSRGSSEFEMKIESDDSVEKPRNFVESRLRLASKNDIPSKNDILEESNSPMTKSVGTKTFASPEQLSADVEKFDQRADIWSLGLIFLLLFHPMSTYMEQIQIMNTAKSGKVPSELEKEYLEIALVIRKMLSKDPGQRPGLKDILKGLKLPRSDKSMYSGKIELKKENSEDWNTKWIKVDDDSLFLYGSEYDKKAEAVFPLSQWKINLQELEDKNSDFEDNEYSVGSDSFELETSNSTQPSNKSLSKKPFVLFENPVQLGCFLRAGDSLQTIELYRKLVKF